MQGLILAVFLSCWRIAASFGAGNTTTIIAITVGALAIVILGVACAKHGFTYQQVGTTPVKNP